MCVFSVPPGWYGVRKPMIGWVGSAQYRDAVSRGLKRECSVCFVMRYGGQPRMFGCGGRVSNVWIS